MAIFMLDCDSVTSTASSINSLATQFSQLADSVNGYDTSCEDGFDFAGGKAAIAANIEACTIKVQNTVKLVEGVVTSHTTLQNSFTLEQNGSTESETQNKETTGSNTVTNNGTNSSYNGSTTGGNAGTNTGTYTGSTAGTNTGSYGSSAGTNTGTGYGGGNSGASSGSYVGAGVASGVGAGVASGGGFSTTVSQNPVDVTGKVNAVDQVTVDIDKLDPENKTQFITGMTYNQNGYATFEDKYVIVCDTSLAKVGDNIIFTKPDGSKIDCVVGAVVDYSQEYKGNVSFIVNNNWNVQNANNLTFDFTNMKITNNGQYVPKEG